MTLEELREQIDAIDDQLLILINQRMELVHSVGELKNTTGTPIYRPEREQSILNRLKANNKGKLTNEAIDALFLEIFAVARNLELPELVAYLGPVASFTHQAAESKFGAMSSYLPITSIEGVFHEVSKGQAKYGVIPIENNTNGIVSDTIQCLATYELKIIAEVVIDVHHSFASVYDNVEDINKIYSKDMAFGQCRNFLTNLGLEKVEQIPVESTAKAAQLALVNENSAAICSRVAATINNLPILFHDIEDSPTNKTRFFIVSNFDNMASGDDKTSLLVKLPNEPGALVRFLHEFERAKINLTKIKSHIVEGSSVFFLEFAGHRADKHIAAILDKYHESIHFLGSYVREADDI